MKVAIVGSINFTNYELVKKYLDSIKINEIATYIISGGAKGVDTLAQRYAKENGIEMLVFKAEWDKYGKSAGFVRNEKMIRNSDIVIAIWDGVSRGTKNSINWASKLKKPLYVYTRGSK